MHDFKNPSKHSKRSRLGNSKAEVSALGFGGAPIGDKSSELSMDNVVEAIETAFMAGIFYFDTAPLYGLGPVWNGPAWNVSIFFSSTMFHHVGTGKTLTNVSKRQFLAPTRPLKSSVVLEK